MSEMKTEISPTVGFFQRLKNVVCYEPLPGEKVPWYWFPIKNRFCRLVWYSIIVFSTTLVYYGWQPFSQMLFMKGAYVWKCPAGERILSNTPACDAQDSAVQSLYQVGMASEFIIGLVAGISLDRLGPLLTGIIGQLLFFCGWQMLMYSTQSIQLYIPAMMCLAGAVNMIAFPTLILGDYFPKKSGLAMSFVVACQTAGTAITPILKAVWDANPQWHYNYLIWGYLFTVWLPCVILALLSLPLVRPELARKRREKIADAAAEALSLDSGSAHPEESNNKEELLVRESGVDAATPDVAIKDKAMKEKGFFKLIVTSEYIGFSIYYILQLLQYGYYPTTVLSEYGTKVSDFQGNFLPTQGVWGVLFGLAVDKTGTLPLCIALNTMMTATYALAMIRNTNLQYFTSVLYVVSNSYIYTVKYTYVADIFPSTNFGVLVGLIGFLGGVFTLINIPVGATKKYNAICSAYIVVGCCCYVVIAYLMFRKWQGHTHKQIVQDAEERISYEEDARNSIQSVASHENVTNGSNSFEKERGHHLNDDE